LLIVPSLQTNFSPEQCDIPPFLPEHGLFAAVAVSEKSDTNRTTRIFFTSLSHQLKIRLILSVDSTGATANADSLISIDYMPKSPALARLEFGCVVDGLGLLKKLVLINCSTE
jgi:hypothetical protein